MYHYLLHVHWIYTVHCALFARCELQWIQSFTYLYFISWQYIFKCVKQEIYRLIETSTIEYLENYRHIWNLNDPIYIKLYTILEQINCHIT